MRRPALALFMCSALLAGCDWMRLPRNEASPLEAEDVFTPASPDAVLLYGVTLRQARPPAEGASGGEVTWMLERADKSFPAIVTIAFPDGLQPNRRAIVAWRVPAGTWSVRQVTWHDDSHSGGSLPAAGRALATTLAPGSVTYAGDIQVDADRQPAELAVGDDATAARAALGPFVGVAAPLADFPVKDLRAGSDAGSRKSGGY